MLTRDGEVKWLPVRTVAKRLGVSMARVYQLIEKGDLCSIKIDLTTLVSCRSIEALEYQRRRRGRRAA